MPEFDEGIEDFARGVPALPLTFSKIIDDSELVSEIKNFFQFIFYL